MESDTSFHSLGGNQILRAPFNLEEFGLLTGKTRQNVCMEHACNVQRCNTIT